MKKGILIAVAIIAIVIGLVGGSYNGLVTKQETVETKLADVKTYLQRRTDLIPNLVNTVKGFTEHETEIINSITEARTKLVNAKTVNEMSEANDNLSAALNSLNIIVENYPELTSDTVYINLMDELAGTENRIAISRTNYNEAVKNYNAAVKKFPTNLIARIFSFDLSEYFEASDKANEVPEVNF